MSSRIGAETLTDTERKRELAGGADQARGRAEAGRRAARRGVDQLHDVAFVEIDDRRRVGLARERGEDPVVDRQPGAVDCNCVDVGVAAVLPVGIDLNRAHGKNQRRGLRRGAAVGEPVLGQDLPGAGESGRPQLDVLNRPFDAGDRHRACGEPLFHACATRRAMQRAAEPNERCNLRRTAARL
ncbi:MAG: hypothetical protein ABR863_08425 [Roseiarcus sp.]